MIFSPRWMSWLAGSFGIALLGSPAGAWAYPEMIRHGYVNCTSCHVSPGGGGTLTPYGRELSKEILPYSAQEGESSFLYGALTPPEWLLGGGDVRALYLYMDNPFVRQGEWILMQADLELAANFEKWALDATVGVSEERRAGSDEQEWVSRRHFLLYRVDDSISVRAGRFYPVYGLMIPDHQARIRKELGWDQRQETYNVEASYSTERWNLFGTAILGRLGITTIDLESGGSLAGYLALGENSKVGASLLRVELNGATRTAGGLSTVLGLTKELYWMSELDVQSQAPSTGSSQTVYTGFSRVGYEAVQGFHLLVQQEFSRRPGVPTASLTAHGLGANFFPRPHFELNFLWQKQKIPSLSAEWVDQAYLLLHYYL